MRELHEKDLAQIAKKVSEYKVVLEAVNEEMDSFTLHVRARGKGGGTLFTARGGPRSFKNVETALRLVKEHFGEVNEILVLLEPRKRDERKNAAGSQGTAGKNPEKPRGKRPP